MPRLISGKANLTTPVAQRTSDGLFVGHTGDVWLYRVMPHDALQWEDADVRQVAARRWLTLFVELGLHSHLPPPGIRSLRSSDSGLRQFHLLSAMWDEVPIPPDVNSWSLREMQHRIFRDASAVTTQKQTVMGVRLRRSGIVSRAKGVRSHLSELADTVTGHEVDLTPYAADRTLISGILQKAGGRVPTDLEAKRTEWWWNGGRASDVLLVPSPDGRSIAGGAWPAGLNFQAVIGFSDAQMDPAMGLWLNDVFSANEGCVAVSMRGEVYPASGVNALFRKTRRKARTQMEEQLATADVDRGEDRELAAAAQQLEDLYRESQEPVIRNSSVIFARVANEASHTYADLLSQRWGLEVKTIELRQAQALQETLPCGPIRFARETPFSQDLSVGNVAGSGVTSFSAIGDDEGVWIGMSLSDTTPIFVDPAGAAKANVPPAMAVVGESGSGKTFLLQLIATQAAADHAVVMVNPKPADSLDGFARAAGGETVRMSSNVHNPGALDPFRFARTPQDAAQIAASHIKSVLELSQIDALHLDSGLLKAAGEGAQCVGDALRHPLISAEVRETVQMLCEGQPLFAQGISWSPRGRMGLVDDSAAREGRGSLTLVEFDRQLTLPTSMDRALHTRDEQIAMAAVRLVCNAALESMFASGGGVLIVDEAHVLMGSSEGARIITRLGREGRSQRILPILATQLLADIMEGSANMVSHLSRVCVLKMRDPREAVAALNLLKLEPTEERLGWLSAAGPIRGERGSLGLFRDLQDRVSGFVVGPIPSDVERLFSTNPLDRDEIAAGMPT